MTDKTVLIDGNAMRVMNHDDGSVTIKSAGGANITNKFREAFEAYTPGARWTQQLASGDIIQLDGNAAAASYLSISKDPLSAGTVSTIETIETFGMPFDAALGLHMSQRTLGQEFSVEFVSTDAPLPAPADLAIASISQTTTTLTVNTALPQNVPIFVEFPTELVTTANAALNANLSAAGTVRANFQGYTSA